MNTDSDTIPTQVLVAYGLKLKSSITAAGGLINQTWIVTTHAGERFVVQRLHPIFTAEVNQRIEFVTRRLEAQGVCTPRLVLTLGGGINVTIRGAIWRTLTYVPGISYDVLPDEHHAHETGGILARFHAAFVGSDDIEGLPSSTTHDLSRHLEALRAALIEHVDHVEHTRVAAAAREIFSFAGELPAVRLSTPRLVHGDPKVSNVLFDDAGNAVCLVDLDTVGLMALVWELGDAFRSWCNPAGEDTENTLFSLELFGASLAGYMAVANKFINSTEVAGIVPAIQTIYTELAARFCADALREDYFAWDPKRFSTRAEHNLIRARGQLNAALDLVSKEEQAVRIVQRVCAAGS